MIVCSSFINWDESANLTLRYMYLSYGTIVQAFMLPAQNLTYLIAGFYCAYNFGYMVSASSLCLKLHILTLLR